MTNQPEEVMTSATLDAVDGCVPAEWRSEDATQTAEEDTTADATESFVQKTFGPATDTGLEEGRPWSPPAPDPFLAAFKEHLREAAADLERQIADIESTGEEMLEALKGDLALLEKQQIVAGFRAWKLVDEGKVPVSTMDEYALTAGIKAHGNEKIPCSRLMRAIVATGVTKGTPASQRKRARASSYASGTDFGIRQGMTEEEFAAELQQPRKRGERHGIEYLAAEGRKARRTTKSLHEIEQLAEALDGLEDAGGFLISGNFSGVEQGYRLIVINVPAETMITETRGQIIDPVDDALVQRILRQWIKARTAMAQDANAT
jgi:hypothetical protein